MAASHRKSGITARDLLRGPADGEPGERPLSTPHGPIQAATPLEEILRLLQAATAGEIEVVDEEGRLEGTITQEGALRTLGAAVADLSEERRVLQLAVERQRQALDEASARLDEIRETLTLLDEIRRGSAGAETAVEHALGEIRRILSRPTRG
ncbi:MAG TPA: hypothetical protein VID50_03615 [Candidatus Eisenbacteria bacterium]